MVRNPDAEKSCECLTCRTWDTVSFTRGRDLTYKGFNQALEDTLDIRVLLSKIMPHLGGAQRGGGGNPIELERHHTRARTAHAIRRYPDLGLGYTAKCNGKLRFWALARMTYHFLQHAPLFNVTYSAWCVTTCSV